MILIKTEYMHYIDISRYNRSFLFSFFIYYDMSKSNYFEKLYKRIALLTINANRYIYIYIT